MKKLAIISLILGMAIGVVMPVHAIVDDRVDVVVQLNGQTIPGTFGSEGKASFFNATPNFQLTSGDILTSLNVLFNPDPQIAYGLSVIDFGAPSNFAFTFITPIVPVVGPNVVQTSFSASTTDGGPAGVPPSLTITANPPPAGIPVDGDGITEVQVATVFDGAVRNNLGLDLAGPSFVAATFPSDTWGPFNPAAIAGPVSLAGWNSLQVDVNFGLSGGGDIATLNGLAKIDASVPEPATLLLLGLGMVGLIGSGRKRVK